MELKGTLNKFSWKYNGVSIYANYKSPNQKQLPAKSPRKVNEKSLNASLEKPLKDNFVGNSFQKKHFISPRATTQQDKGNIYNSLSNRKAMLSTSLGFAPGALKEKINNSNVVDRLSSHTRIIFYVLWY